MLHEIRLCPFFERFLPDALALQFPVHDQFGMHPPEILGDVAVPADGTVGLEKLLRPEILPLDRFVIGREQGGA